ncbi:hypothetical protein DFJ77DRAFT_480197 [Powellomyces hirtus]|nr:hypothetical protein DFJ77DRAFT_480197 [Powellomyces hirtus]
MVVAQHSIDDPPPDLKPSPSGPSRLRTTLYVVLSLPLLLSPFSLVAGVTLYVVLLLAVAVYAGYIALKEFILYDLFNRTAPLPPRPSPDDEEALPGFLASSKVARAVALGPPVVVYLGSRGVVTGLLHGTRYTVIQTVRAVPRVGVAAIRLGRSVGRVGVRVAHGVQEMGRWVRTPVVEICITLQGVASAVVDVGVWIGVGMATAGWDGVVGSVRMARKVVDVGWDGAVRIGVMLRPVVDAMTVMARALLFVPRALIAATHDAGAAIARTAHTVLVSHLLPALNATASALATTIRTVIIPFTRSLIADMDTLARHITSLTIATLTPLAHAATRLSGAITRVATTVLSHIHTLATTLSGRVLTLTLSITTTLHAILAPLANPLLTLLTHHLPTYLDTACVALETTLTHLAHHTAILTRYVHAAAAPLFSTAIATAQPLVRALLGAALRATALALAAAHTVLQLATHILHRALMHVQLAARRARRVRDSVGDEVARVVSLATRA